MKIRGTLSSPRPRLASQLTSTHACPPSNVLRLNGHGTAGWPGVTSPVRWFPARRSAQEVAVAADLARAVEHVDARRGCVDRERNGAVRYGHDAAGHGVAVGAVAEA